MKLYHHLRKHKLLLITFILLSAINGIGQNVGLQLRFARSLESNREFEDALKIYQQLDEPMHQNIAVVSGIKNCLKNLMRYKELVDYLEAVIKHNKRNNNLMLDLGEAYVLTDRKELAMNLWNQLINTQKSNISIYKMVAATMIRLRMIDEAIEIYQQALQNIKGQYYLHLEMANLYKSRLDLAQAVYHYLAYYQHFPKQKVFLQRQILSLTQNSQQIEPVIEVLKKHIQDHKDNKSIKEILGGLYIKERKFVQAYDIYQSLENKKSNGKYLIQFGEEAQKNKAYPFAVKAFSKIISDYEKSDLRGKAQYELAKTFYFIAQQYQEEGESQIAAENVEKAIHIFKSLLQKKSVRSFSARSSLSLGDIYLNHYFDVDKAVYYFNFIGENFKRSNVFNRAMIKLGDAYIIKGDLEKARQAYRRLKENKNMSIATFKQAEIDFFKGRFSEAKTKYNQIIEKYGVTDSLANNCLERTMLLNNFSSDTTDLRKIAHGELLIFQKKYSEAIETLSELVTPESQVATLAGRLAAQLLLQLEKYAEASILLSKIIDTFPDDYHLDEFVFMLAMTEEKLGYLQKSFTLYQQILTEFPTSLYYEKARIKARELNERLKKA